MMKRKPMTELEIAQERIEELEREALDAAELEERIEELETELESEPGKIFAERIRELLTGLTCFPERDCPEFYDALDAYDVARARQG